MKVYNVKNKKGKLVLSTIDKFEFYSFVLTHVDKDYVCQLCLVKGKVERTILIPIKDLSLFVTDISKATVECIKSKHTTVETLN